MTDSQVQKNADHYTSKRYIHRERWLNYWYQLEAVFKMEVRRVLEIGVGNHIVADVLTAVGHAVDTVDIDPALSPTYVASVTDLPFEDATYDVVVCAEVLEHLPFSEAERAMRELARVSRRHVLVTLPHAGSTVSLLFKIPLIPWQRWNWKIPHLWKRHEFDGQHYWEVGKRGFSRRRIKRALAAAGLVTVSCRIRADDPSHVFFICQKTAPDL